MSKRKLHVYVVHSCATEEDGKVRSKKEHKIHGIYFEESHAYRHKHKLLCKNYNDPLGYLCVTKHSIQGSYDVYGKYGELVLL